MNALHTHSIPVKSITKPQSLSGMNEICKMKLLRMSFKLLRAQEVEAKRKRKKLLYPECITCIFTLDLLLPRHGEMNAYKKPIYFSLQANGKLFHQKCRCVCCVWVCILFRYTYRWCCCCSNIYLRVDNENHKQKKTKRKIRLRIFFLSLTLFSLNSVVVGNNV